VIIAMIAVGMMQASIDQIVDMIPMRHRLMTAAGPMPMLGIMSAGTMLWAAAIRIGVGHLDHVLIDTPVMRMMEMAMVQIIDVAVVANRNVATARPVDVPMIGRGHGFFLSRW
jgi:hypothetical protein